MTKPGRDGCCASGIFCRHSAAGLSLDRTLHGWTGRLSAFGGPIQGLSVVDDDEDDDDDEVILFFVKCNRPTINLFLNITQYIFPKVSLQ